MPVMRPATSERNLTPSSAEAVSPPSTIAGVGLLGQIIVVVVAALIVMLSALVTLCAPAVTRTVKFDVPVAVGLPEITPEFAFNVRPAGSVPFVIAHVYGGVPPLAASVAV